MSAMRRNQCCRLGDIEGLSTSQSSRHRLVELMETVWMESALRRSKLENVCKRSGGRVGGFWAVKRRGLFSLWSKRAGAHSGDVP